MTRREHVEICYRIITNLHIEDEQTNKLARVVLLALDKIQDNHTGNDNIKELSVWANQNFVQGYFASIVALNSVKVEAAKEFMGSY